MSGPVTLRVLGTSVTLLESIRLRAEQELGIRVEYQIHDVQTVQRIALMHPESYDLYDQWFHSMDFVWPAGAIQPIDIRRVALWDEINDLAKRGRLHADDELAGGSLPCDLCMFSMMVAWPIAQPTPSACYRSRTTRTALPIDPIFFLQGLPSITKVGRGLLIQAGAAMWLCRVMPLLEHWTRRWQSRQRA